MGVTESAPRVLRVFVSSTFRDMQAERDELVKRVFPQIRRLCEARGVVWGEIDLRWGVTDEQKAEGEVLGICLDEIDRTRPYFIGLLGQRYGWVPDAIPAALAERMGWLAAGQGRSVTELEILHGVLNDPDATGYARFYLRDPAWLDTLADPAPYTEETAAGRAALDDLRRRVRTSRHPVRDYRDPAELADQVLADLSELVERVFPDPAPPDPAERDNADHAAFALARTTGVVARPAITARLDEHATSDGPPLLLHAEPGAGATTAVASWLRGAGDRPVIEHYVGANPGSADWRGLVRRLVVELAHVRGDTPPAADSFTDDVALRSAVVHALAASAAHHPIVVLDGVDQLDDDGSGGPDLTWLPRQLPSGVRLVLTASGERPLEAARRRGWAIADLPPLDEAERRELVVRFLARYAKGLDEVHLRRLTTAPQTGNPLFLRTVLDELRQHGDHFTLGEVIDRLLGAATIDELFRLLLDRFESDFERDRAGLTRELFSLLAVAHRGLEEAELRDLLSPSPGEPLPRAVLSPLYLAAIAQLVDRNGLVSFASRHFRHAVEARYLPTTATRRDAHAALAAYFAEQPLGERTVDELAWQQIGAGDEAGLVRTLGDPAFFELAYRRVPAEVRQWWARAIEGGADLAAVYRTVIDDPGAHDLAPADDAPGGQLVWGLARLLTDLGYPADALRLNEYLVQAMRERPESTAERAARLAAGDGRPPTGDGALRAALLNHGAALWLRGDAERAEAPLTEAVERCRRAGDMAMLSGALGNLALVARDLDRVDEALAHSAEEEAICRARDDLAGLQACLGNRAELLRRRGEDDAALALMHEQEQICRDLADRAGVARAQAGQAVVLMERGDIDAAIGFSAAHVATARELGDLRGVTEGLISQTTMHLARGDGHAGLPVAEEAEALARRLDDATLLSRALTGRAQLLAGAGDWPAAERLAREAELTARRVDDWAAIASALTLVGTARREQGDVPGADATHRDELLAAERSGNPAQVGIARANLGAALIAGGRYQDALAEFDAAEAPLRTTRTTTALLPMLANRAQLHQALGNHQAAVADFLDAGAAAWLLGNATGAKQWAEHGVTLAYQLGAPGLAEPGWPTLADACRALGDDDGLQRALGEHALAVINRSQPAGAAGDPTNVDQALLATALPLLDEQEAICRRTGNAVGLAACVGNRAIVRRYQGDVAGALDAVEEQLRIASASGNGQGVLFATANRGELLGLLGRVPEALEALRTARATASQYQLGPMVQQLDAMIQALASRN